MMRAYGSFTEQPAFSEASVSFLMRLFREFSSIGFSSITLLRRGGFMRIWI